MQDREKAVETAKVIIKNVIASIDKIGVYRALEIVYTALVTLAYGTDAGVTPMNAKDLVEYTAELADRAGGKMNSEGEHDNSLRMQMEMLGIKKRSSNPEKCHDASDLDLRDILKDILDNWDENKRTQTTYHILLYAMRYSQIHEGIITQKDRVRLIRILSDMVNTPME